MGKENGQNIEQSAGFLENVGRSIPLALRDRQGRVIWELPKNTLEENKQLGISNMQGLFLAKFPEFEVLFPRKENEKIEQDKIEMAKKFILQRINRQNDFNDIFGSSPNDYKKAPYFKGSYIVARNEAFLPWGIDLVEREEEIRLSGKDVSDKVVKVMPQTQGIEALRSFFAGKQLFSELGIFFISKAWFGGKGYGQVQISQSEFRERTTSMTLNRETSKVLQRGGLLLVIPREDDYKYYQWIDLYKVEDGNVVNLEQVIGSLRVDIKNSTFTGMGWHGPEIQLFLDFLAGERAIGTEQLKDFRTKIINSGRYNAASIGRINGRNIRLNISDPECFPGQEIIFKIKKIDETFSLLQGFASCVGNLERVVCERKFCKGDLKLYMLKESSNISEEGELISSEEANEWLRNLLQEDEDE